MAPYTVDADLVLDPAALRPEPLLQDLLERAGFSRSPDDVGRWAKAMTVDEVPRSMVVDLLVPDAVGGPGRRGARIAPHDRRVARKVVGLEGALVDRDRRIIRALDGQDKRRIEVAVAGPGALLLAKSIKIGERAGESERRQDKDALDVLRLLQSVPTDELLQRLGGLRRDEVSRDVAALGLEYLAVLFDSPSSAGSRMAARAAAPLEPEETTAGAATALAQDLLEALGKG